MKTIQHIARAAALVLLVPGLVFGLNVHFREDVVVRSPMLTLGDVADVSGGNGADAVRGAELFRGPERGGKRCYSTSTLRLYAAAAVSEALGRDPEIGFGGAERVCVLHDAKMIGSNEIIGMINTRLKEALGHLDAEKLAFVPRSKPEALSVPHGEIDYEVRFSASDIVSSRRATIIIKADGRIRHNVVVAGDVRAHLPVVVAAADLDRKTVIGREHIRTEVKNINGLRNPLTDPADAIGMTLCRSVKMNRVLRQSDVERPLLIERRQIVTVIASKGPLEISTRGEALASGRKGDVVKIRNMHSRQEVYARVVGDGIAKVEF